MYTEVPNATAGATPIYIMGANVAATLECGEFFAWNATWYLSIYLYLHSIYFECLFVCMKHRDKLCCVEGVFS